MTTPTAFCHERRAELRPGRMAALFKQGRCSLTLAFRFSQVLRLKTYSPVKIPNTVQMRQSQL